MCTRTCFDTYLRQVVKLQGEPLRVIEIADAYINMKERHVHLCIHTCLEKHLCQVVKLEGEPFREIEFFNV